MNSWLTLNFLTYNNFFNCIISSWGKYLSNKDFAHLIGKYLRNRRVLKLCDIFLAKNRLLVYSENERNIFSLGFEIKFSRKKNSFT
jgi:hypothetical protein